MRGRDSMPAKTTIPFLVSLVIGFMVVPSVSLAGAQRVVVAEEFGHDL